MQPRAQACGICGKNTLNTVLANTYETGPTQRTCGHSYPYGTDLVWTVHYIYQYVCTNCGYRSSTWETTGTRVECHGYYG